MKYLVTFMSSGAITVDAKSSEAAKQFFEDFLQGSAMRELTYNGIEVTDVTEVEE